MSLGLWYLNVKVTSCTSGGNCDLHLDSSFNVDDNLLHDLGWGIETVANDVSTISRLDISIWTHSISLLCILISNMSHVFEPSPQGVFRVEIFKLLVGRRTGPLTRRSLDLARSMSSWQTFSSDLSLRDVKVMRILWIFYEFCSVLVRCTMLSW